MSLVLLKRITDKALKTYNGPEATELGAFHQHWLPHWFNTAVSIRDEFKLENLPNTVKEVERLIEEQQRICQYTILPNALEEFPALPHFNPHAHGTNEGL
jgi:hypothetical protein